MWSDEYKGQELVKNRCWQMQLNRVTTEEEFLAEEGLLYGSGPFFLFKATTYLYIGNLDLD